KYLPAFTTFSVKCAGVRFERCAAGRTSDLGPETVLDDAVRAVGLEQGFADMTVLPTGLAPGLVPQTLGLGRRVEVASVERGWSTAVATIAFKFAHSRLKRIDTIPQLQDQISNGLGIALGKSDELFTAWAFGRH